MEPGACPDISLVGETSVSGALQAMDCHINSAVQIGYDRLFGPGGAFGFALTSLLIIYVALIAYGFLTGRTRLTVVMMSPRIMTMVLVLTFVSFWPAYHAVFYGLLMGGPDEIAAALLHQHGSAVMNFAQSLDGLFVRFAEIARSLDTGVTTTVATTTAQPVMVLPHSMPVQLFWLSGLFLLVSTLGALVLTRLVLYLLLILGPVFIIFALFPQTRGLFNGWLRTSLIFALSPLLTVLGGTAALMLFVPLIDAIGNDPQGAVKAVQPMVILFMGSLIYCAFLFTLIWVAASLVRDWQATFRDKAASDTPAPQIPAQPQAHAAVAHVSGASFQGRAASADTYERTEPLVVAVSREAPSISSAGTVRSENSAPYDPQARQTSGDRFNRVQGLGQKFRDRTSQLGTPPLAAPNAPATAQKD